MSAFSTKSNATSASCLFTQFLCFFPVCVLFLLSLHICSFLALLFSFFLLFFFPSISSSSFLIYIYVPFLLCLFLSLFSLFLCICPFFFCFHSYLFPSHLCLKPSSFTSMLPSLFFFPFSHPQ